MMVGGEGGWAPSFFTFPASPKAACAGVHCPPEKKITFNS